MHVIGRVGPWAGCEISGPLMLSAPSPGVDLAIESCGLGSLALARGRAAAPPTSFNDPSPGGAFEKRVLFAPRGHGGFVNPNARSQSASRAPSARTAPRGGLWGRRVMFVHVVESRLSRHSGTHHEHQQLGSPGRAAHH